MAPSPIFSRLAVAMLLALAGGTLAWLLLGFGNNNEGQHLLGEKGAGPTGGAPLFTLEQLIEPDHGFTREAVGQMAPEKWRPWTGSGMLAWRGPEAAWLRVTVRNPGARAVRGVLADRDYFMDRVEAWIPDDAPAGEAGWSHLRSGETVPLAEKALAGRETAFPVEVPAHGERVVYLRAQDRMTAYVRLAWWPDQAKFQVMRARSSLAEGIYFGGLCALFCYNVVLWLRLRLADLGYYSLYLGTFVSFILLARGHLTSLGWMLTSPWLETMIVLSISLNGFFLASLGRILLEVKAQPAWAHRLVRGLQVLMLLLALGALTMPWTQSFYIFQITVRCIGLTHLGLLVLAIWAWRRGVRQARFFLWAFGCLFASSLPAAAAWIWDESLKDLTMQGLMVGSGMEMLLLALATADRFARAQRQLLEETEQRRVIQEAYADELATEVRERTQELEHANADKDRMLAVIGHDLRSPLTGLMRSASHPTAEFARDTARTGRELLLMIEDLVLWAQMRAGTCVIGAHPARALLVPAVALHRSLAAHGEMELALEVPDGLRVETDLVLAQTLVRNLLANALKFAHRRVVLRAMEDGQGGVRFTVTNDGPALPPELIARLEADQDVPMTAMGGLGLRLCREICAALRMRLSARAPAEGGAQFGFTMKMPETLAEEAT